MACRPNGKLLVPAAPGEPLTISMLSLIAKRSSVAGWYSGTARDSQDTLEFSALSGVHPMIEKYPLTAWRKPTSKCTVAKCGSAWF